MNAWTEEYNFRIPIGRYSLCKNEKARIVLIGSVPGIQRAIKNGLLQDDLFAFLQPAENLGFGPV